MLKYKICHGSQQSHNGEFFCGPPGCNQFDSNPDFRWTPAETAVNATLGGATWSLSVPLYDHAHNYRVTAWAIDRNGKADQSRAVVNFKASVN